MGKAKPAKHTSAELKAKQFAATVNRGGGQAGHAKFKCPICAMQAPDLKTMQMHHESKHSKLPWDPDKCVNMHKAVGVTTQGISVVGSKKKK